MAGHSAGIPRVRRGIVELVHKDASMKIHRPYDENALVLAAPALFEEFQTIFELLFVNLSEARMAALDFFVFSEILSFVFRFGFSKLGFFLLVFFRCRYPLTLFRIFSDLTIHTTI